MPFLTHAGSLGISIILLATGALVPAQPIDGLREGAEQGNATAQFSLGKRYANGQGVRNQEITTQQDFYEYLLLATTRTSTMEQEMNKAGEDGYRFQKVMGGDIALGGSEMVSLMMKERAPDGTEANVVRGRFSYRLLATNQTSTMQAEMQELGQEGYDYRGVTVFESFFGGDEVVVIMELDNKALHVSYDYVLLATSRTSTLQAELTEVGQRGFKLVGMAVGDTVFGGDEVIAITRRTVPR